MSFASKTVSHTHTHTHTSGITVHTSTPYIPGIYCGCESKYLLIHRSTEQQIYPACKHFFSGLCSVFKHVCKPVYNDVKGLNVCCLNCLYMSKMRENQRVTTADAKSNICTELPRICCCADQTLYTYRSHIQCETGMITIL